MLIYDDYYEISDLNTGEDELKRYCRDEGLDYLYTVASSEEEPETYSLLIFLKNLLSLPQ
ncbi:hypothetical protein OXPF_37450 [Oxobacter pfennigii]|uniref:Uncharacterized protein n=1 Tax=Oxobacter pfennigii TaxID=36849 RepID=A0A0P8W4K2_9CLOT|nr:hypothetical protein [Oxobacter pfennigii]KPU42691.1 hypothetical protein OXPF_37450 [Oxobacter pfennigii]